jgi:hypothetical protein
MNLIGNVGEFLMVPYYQRRPLEIFRYIYAKWQFKLNRLDTAEEFLKRLDISPDTALAGYSRWRPLLKDAIDRMLERDSIRTQQGGISEDDGKVLYGIVRSMRPGCVIETGVAAGIANSFINAALLENEAGILYSIELPPADVGTGMHQDGGRFGWQAFGVGWAVPPEIRQAIGSRNILILEDVRTALPRLLRDLPQVDFFFHDDLHTPDHMVWEYNTVWPHLAVNGLLVSDDSNFGWIRFCRERKSRDRQFLNLSRLTAIRKT